MSRNYKKSPAEETFTTLVKISSVMPWWATVGLALLLFLLVPSYVLEEGGSLAPDQVLGMLLGVIFAMFFKYFVPLALFLGGATNLLNRGKSAWMFNNISQNGAKETLRQLSWKDFEFLVSEYFKKEGYQVDLIDAQGADGGVDIRLHKDEELYLVQCKHYKAWKVSVKVVRELYGVMAAESAVGGFVVTTGKFTKDAIAFASDKQVELIDGTTLENVLDRDLVDTSTEKTDPSSDNVCPRCGNELVKRNGSRGGFLGCSSFPKCKYTKNLD
jgi:restriction system protein